jgi:photosystem II stability/assembly factor-like uncharacterized protein
LYSKNKERGLYKTIDGGKTWKKVLYIDDNTGVIDIKVHPTNPNILLAASWERFRQAHDFIGNGKGSTIWRSEDGGDTWKKSVSGFPQDEFVGRSGLRTLGQPRQVNQASSCSKTAPRGSAGRKSN